MPQIVRSAMWCNQTSLKNVTFPILCHHAMSMSLGPGDGFVSLADHPIGSKSFFRKRKLRPSLPKVTSCDFVLTLLDLLGATLLGKILDSRAVV